MSVLSHKRRAEHDERNFRGPGRLSSFALDLDEVSGALGDLGLESVAGPHGPLPTAHFDQSLTLGLSVLDFQIREQRLTLHNIKRLGAAHYAAARLYLEAQSLELNFRLAPVREPRNMPHGSRCLG